MVMNEIVSSWSAFMHTLFQYDITWPWLSPCLHLFHYWRGTPVVSDNFRVFLLCNPPQSDICWPLILSSYVFPNILKIYLDHVYMYAWNMLDIYFWDLSQKLLCSSSIFHFSLSLILNYICHSGTNSILLAFTPLTLDNIAILIINRCWFLKSRCTCSSALFRPTPAKISCYILWTDIRKGNCCMTILYWPGSNYKSTTLPLRHLWNWVS